MGTREQRAPPVGKDDRRTRTRIRARWALLALVGSVMGAALVDHSFAPRRGWPDQRRLTVLDCVGSPPRLHSTAAYRAFAEATSGRVDPEELSRLVRGVSLSGTPLSAGDLEAARSLILANRSIFAELSVSDGRRRLDTPPRTQQATQTSPAEVRNSTSSDPRVLSKLGKLVLVSVAVADEDGDGTLARRRLELALDIASALADSGGLTEWDLALALVQRAARVALALGLSATCSAGERQVLIDQLAEAEGQISRPADALRGEWPRIEARYDVVSRGGAEALAQMRVGPDGTPRPSERTYAWLMLAYAGVDDGRVWAQDRMARLGDAMSPPASEAGFRDLLARTPRDWCARREYWQLWVLGEWLWRLEAFHRNYFTALAEVRGVQVALLLHAYGEREGRPAASLDDIAPSHSAAASVADPWDGAQFRYRAGREGAVLYSVGPNCKDDSACADDQVIVGTRDGSAAEHGPR